MTARLAPTTLLSAHRGGRRVFSSCCLCREAMAPVSTVEHVVLFRVKDGADPAAVDAWLSALRSLASLPVVAHLAAAPALRCRASPSALPLFTHVLHCRYRSQADLAAYAAHPAHLAVVRQLGLPICDDLLAVDWVADVDPAAVAVKQGAAARVTLVRLREGAGDAGKGELVAALGGIGGSFPAVEQVSCGENFSPARARGFAVGAIWVFSRSSELDLLDVAGSAVVWKAEEEAVNPLTESVIVVDFVVPPTPESSSPIEQSSLPRG
uniref:Stress-response A/B barrel domain-containing protein n=1 Tax=Anthurium amnicola TaxID=1678845 RepID=A0A1D1YST0_9ARAE